MLKIRYTCLFVFILLFSACSTPPKNPGDILDLRKRAENQLELANKNADRGNLDEALTFAGQANRLAIAVDDPDLRVRTGLSLGNVFFLLGYQDEAGVEWSNALAEAERSGNRELAAVCRIHIARGKLLSPGGKAFAQSVRDETRSNISLITSSRHYTAFAWTVIGLAERDLGRYAEAETALRHALDIHMKDRYFELAAYDWFLIASFRSLSGNYPGALQALEAAITLDRRIENTWGLANDWRAIGDVQTKAGNPAAARSAYIRAAEIFLAIGAEEIAEEILSKIKE